MTLPVDPDPKLAAYAHPARLVTTAWLADQLADGCEIDLVVVESDEDVLLYETGHIPGAVKVDWHTDLNDPLTRDYVDGAAFAALMSAKGISRESTVVIYGDRSNWWAAYALWVFTLFGHPDVRLLDGGRAAWLAENRPMTTDIAPREPSSYPEAPRDDATVRAFQADVLSHLGAPMIDVRSPGEFSGELLHMPDYPQEGAMRGGHIPGARNVPWAKATNADGRFRPVEELRSLYEGEAGLAVDSDTVVYCRIGERSSHTWFVLTHLLGHERVRNYDGSWTEWGNSVRVPIERGA